MNKTIFYKSSNKSNYKKIENIQEESLEENKTITNNKVISEKKSYLQLLNKIQTSLTVSNKDVSNSIIHIYDNYEAQLLCLHKLLNGTDFDEKKYFIQALKTKLDSYKQQDKKKSV